MKSASRTVFPAFCLSLLAGFLAGCSESGSAGSAADATRTRHYSKQDFDAAPAVALTREQSFCAAVDACTFQNIDIGLAGPEGRTVLIGPGSPIRSFRGENADSGITIGKRGSGPGEYRMVIAAALDSAGDIVVLDGGLRATRFSVTGEYRSDWRVPMPPPVTAGLTLAGTSVYVFVIPPAARIGDQVTAMIARLAEGAKQYLPLLKFPWRAASTSNSDLVPLPPLFQANLQWDVDDNGALATSPGDEYRIDLFDKDGGNTLRMIADVTPEKVTAADIEAQSRKMLGDKPPPPDFKRQLDAAAERAAEFHPVIAGVVYAAGRIWVRRHTRPDAASTRWDVFSATGDFDGWFELPARARLLTAREDRVLVTEYDELDVPRATWFRMSRAPASN